MKRTIVRPSVRGILMVLIVLVASTTELLPALQPAATCVGAEAVLTSHIEAIRVPAIDIVLWSPNVLDKRSYERLWTICPRIMICVERGVFIPRWYPRYSPYGPLYYLIRPLDPDDLCVLFRSVLDQQHTWRVGDDTTD